MTNIPNPPLSTAALVMDRHRYDDTINEGAHDTTIDAQGTALSAHDTLTKLLNDSACVTKEAAFRFLRKYYPHIARRHNWEDPASINLHSFCFTIKELLRLMDSLFDQSMLGDDALKDFSNTTSVMTNIAEKHVKLRGTETINSILNSHLTLVDAIKDKEASNTLNKRKSEREGEERDICGWQFLGALLEERRSLG
jgi:hypothetical protein